MSTGVPAGVFAKSTRSTPLRNLMQPFDTSCPIDHGSFVP